MPVDGTGFGPERAPCGGQVRMDAPEQQAVTSCMMGSMSANVTMVQWKFTYSFSLHLETPSPTSQKSLASCRMVSSKSPLVVGLEPLRGGFDFVLLGTRSCLKLRQAILRGFQDILTCQLLQWMPWRPWMPRAWCDRSDFRMILDLAPKIENQFEI